MERDRFWIAIDSAAALWMGVLRCYFSVFSNSLLDRMLGCCGWAKLPAPHLANLQIIRYICITLKMAPLAEYTVSASYSSERLRRALPSALLAGWLLQ